MGWTRNAASRIAVRLAGLAMLATLAAATGAAAQNAALVKDITPPGHDGLHGRELWALPLSGPGCEPAAAHLCLAGGRFRVEADWRDFQSKAGTGTAVPLSADTGYFWFFDPANVEVVTKVLDGREVNAKFWLFYGALSSVEYTLTDTATGAVRMYKNPSGNLGSLADTGAF
jgi:hypothetical protein